MRVLIVADDLTGALDSAVTLAGAGLRCVVARRPGDVAAALANRPDVLAVSTASREASAEAAGAAVGAALEAAGTLPEILFKKIDSRLKGQVIAEVAALAGRSSRERALVAPAIPAQGRRVVGGRLIGAGVAAPIDVAAVLVGSGVAVEVPDTRDDADFDAPLARALEQPPTLLVGAAGLAAALARRLAPGAPAVSPPRLAAPILLAIGSRDPITRAQVACLEARGIVAISAAPDGECGGIAEAPARLVRLVARPGRPFDARAAGARFADGIAHIVRTGGVSTLLGCGGETADAILGALGVGVLTIEGELLPGVPVSRMLLGDRRLQLVTKSGGFGCQDALVSVVEAAIGSGKGEG